VSLLQRFLNALRELSIEDAFAVEERDPQMEAVRRLYMKGGREAYSLAVANALVSYQLSMKGERYWLLFAEEVESLEDLPAFLKRHNPRLLRAKMRRLQRVRPFLHRLTGRESYGALYASLSSLFGRQKTVSFAVKMFGYVKRAEGIREPFPFSIPIPYDSRIARLSQALGIGKGDWDWIAKGVGIPPLHLDSLLWNAMAFEGRSPLEELLKEVVE